MIRPHYGGGEWGGNSELDGHWILFYLVHELCFIMLPFSESGKGLENFILSVFFNFRNFELL